MCWGAGWEGNNLLLQPFGTRRKAENDKVKLMSFLEFLESYSSRFNECDDRVRGALSGAVAHCQHIQWTIRSRQICYMHGTDRESGSLY